MGRRHWLVWTGLFAILVAMPLLAVVQPKSFVETTARLNLRSCPDTRDCEILTTLPVGTSLEVIASQDEWLRVTVTEEDRYGWVHSGYVQTLVVPAKRERGILDRVNVDQLILVAWVIALGVLAWRGSRRLKLPARRLAVAAVAAVGYAAAGFLLIMMQFGGIIADYLAPAVALEGFEWLWKFTTISSVEYGLIVLTELVAILLMVLLVPGGAAGRRGLIQGFAAGFVVVPAFVAAMALVGAIGWLLFSIVKVVLLVVWWLSWPLRWIFENLLAPLLLFLAKPLVWLWEEFLLPFVLFISPPFLWFWRVIVSPLLLLAERFVFRPVLIVVAGVVASAVVLAPFIIAGMVIADGLRRGFKGAEDTGELFAQGVAFGLLSIDTVAALCLAELGYIEHAASIPIAILVGITLLGALRTTLFHRKRVFEVGQIGTMASTYMKSSGLGVCFACVTIPIVLVAQLTSEDA